MNKTQLKKLILEEIQKREIFKFKDYPELQSSDGFKIPSDVYINAYLGTIESEPDGYVIKLIDSPTGKQTISKNPQNKFKTKNEAAKMLHDNWWDIIKNGLFKS